MLFQGQKVQNVKGLMSKGPFCTMECHLYHSNETDSGLNGKSPLHHPRTTTCGDGGSGLRSIGKLFSVSHMPV